MIRWICGWRDGAMGKGGNGISVIAQTKFAMHTFSVVIVFLLFRLSLVEGMLPLLLPNLSSFLFFCPFLPSVADRLLPPSTTRCSKLSHEVSPSLRTTTCILVPTPKGSRPASILTSKEGERE